MRRHALDGGLDPPTLNTSSDWKMSVSHEERFHRNVLDFAALLIELNDKCHQKGYGAIDQGILRVAEAALRNFSPITIISSFCHHSRPFWDKIRHHDEDSLKDSLSVIFSNLPVDLSPQIIKLIETKDYTGNRVIDQQDIDDVWSYLEALVKIGLKWSYQEAPSKELENEARAWGIKF